MLGGLVEDVSIGRAGVDVEREVVVLVGTSTRFMTSVDEGVVSVERSGGGASMRELVVVGDSSTRFGCSESNGSTGTGSSVVGEDESGSGLSDGMSSSANADAGAKTRAQAVKTARSRWVSIGDFLLRSTVLFRGCG